MADEVAVEQIDLDKTSMEEYNAARDKGETVVERPVEKPAEKVEEDTEEKVEQQEPEKQEEKHKSKGGGFQKRIEGLTKQAKEAQDRAEAAERRIKELEGGKPKEEPVKAANGKPKMEDYDGTAGKDYERYLLDTAKWEIKEDARLEREAIARKEAEDKGKEVFESHQERFTAAQVKYEDFDEVINIRTPWPQDTPTSSAFHTALIEDENSAEVMYYLGKHPEELAAMGELTPAGVVKAIGRISDKVVPQTEQAEEQEEEKPAKRESKAPIPIKPVGSGLTKSSVPLDQMSQADYEKARAAGRQR